MKGATIAEPRAVGEPVKKGLRSVLASVGGTVRIDRESRPDAARRRDQSIRSAHQTPAG